MRAGWSYVGRRALFALITIFVAVSLNFVLFRLAPGDRTSALRCQGCTEEFKQQLKRDYGLDKSIPEQYLIYLKTTASGDRKSTRLNSSHSQQSRMPSSA